MQLGWSVGWGVSKGGAEIGWCGASPWGNSATMWITQNSKSWGRRKMWNHPASGQEAEVRVERKVESCGSYQPEMNSRVLMHFPLLSPPRVHSLCNWDLTSCQCCILFRHFRFIRGMFSCHLALCKHYFKRWGHHHSLGHYPTVRLDATLRFISAPGLW